MPDSLDHPPSVRRPPTPKPTPAMNASNHGKFFLQLCLAKRLLDKAQAKDIWQKAQESGEPPQVLLVQQNLLALHTVHALEKELREAQEPRAIAGFRIIKPLGQGGMGTVYLATQVSLGREVALKLMSPQIAANPAAVERFLREARVAAAVNHPNVISIIDVGNADGQIYMALELVTGGDAAQLAQRLGGVLPEARALELLVDCTRGLQALYEARLVHRDLKPSNIFITKDGAAKLGDLGLARSEDGEDRLTVTGHLVGTPAFMSPEQASGEGAIDIRSDIYSLGATLFALITGRQPFTGNSPIAVAAKALTQPAPDPRSILPTLSPLTATLILRTMAKAPQDRFQTPQELREALQEAQGLTPQTTTVGLSPRSITVKTTAVFRKGETPPAAVTAATRRATNRATRPTTRPTRVQPSWMLMVLMAVICGLMVFFMTRDGKPLAAETLPASPPGKTTPPVPAAVPNKAVSAVAPSAQPPPKPTPVIPMATVPIGDATASPPPGDDPPRVSWAVDQGSDSYGHWAVITIKGASQRLRWVPPGKCIIGASATLPNRLDLEDEVPVEFTFGIWMADTECTQALYAALIGTIPSAKKGPTLPVTYLTLPESMRFTQALSQALPGTPLVRLPSRAEWERACRAGSTTIYASGDDPESLKGMANVFDLDRGKACSVPAIFAFSDGFVDVAPVASLRPNRWGLFDMHGNVSEYCLGAYRSLKDNRRDPMISEKEAQAGFIKGGSFDSGNTTLLRSSSLPNVRPDSRSEDIGFRFLIECRTDARR